MSIFAKGTPVYLNAPNMAIISGGEPTNKNSKLTGVENIQDYYGDLKQKQNDVIFKEGSLIGKVTGETQILDSTLYYNILVKGVVDKRTSHGWGAGTYEKIDWLGWVSSQFITNDIDLILNKYNKSEVVVETSNVPKIPPVVTYPKTLPVVTDKSIFKQSDPTTGEQKPNYLLYGGIAFSILLIGVGLYWAFGSKPEPQQTTIQYVPQPQPMK